MSFERTIMHVLPESKWRLLRRALESRINEIYNYRLVHRENAEIVRECDEEMEACYELIETIKLRRNIV